MALVAEFIGLLARDAEALRQPLGGQSHREIRIRIALHQRRIAGNLLSADRNHRHRLRAAGDDHIGAADSDSIRRNRDRLQAR